MIENQLKIEDPSHKTDKHRLLDGSLAALSSPNLSLKNRNTDWTSQRK